MRPQTQAAWQNTYIVICVDNGRYFLATRQVFVTWTEAANYARTIAAKRKAVIVEGLFTQLEIL